MPRPAAGTRIRSIRRASVTGTAGSGPATPGHARASPPIAPDRRRPGYTPGPDPGTPQPGYPPVYPQQPAPPPGYGYRQPPLLRRAVTADGVPLAGWWWRVLATVIDGMITSIVVGIIGLPLFRPMADAFRAYFESVMAAQQSGGVPPTFDPTRCSASRAWRS